MAMSPRDDNPIFAWALWATTQPIILPSSLTVRTSALPKSPNPALMSGRLSFEWSFSVKMSLVVGLSRYGSPFRAETNWSFASLPFPVNLPDTGGSAATAGNTANRTAARDGRSMGDLGPVHVGAIGSHHSQRFARVSYDFGVPIRPVRG